MMLEGLAQTFAHVDTDKGREAAVNPRLRASLIQETQMKAMRRSEAN